MIINLINKYESLRQNPDFKQTNASWNKSKINHPKNVGYLMDTIYSISPKNYTEWESYFLSNIYSRDKIKETALKFKDFILQESKLERYKYFSDEFFIDCIECRLIYETWLGYAAELAVINQLKDLNPGINFTHMLCEDDFKYAVDCMLHKDGKLKCGIQIKSEYYMINNSPILKSTKYTNKQKNKEFEEEYKVPVITCYYKRKYNKNNTIYIKLLVDKNVKNVQKIVSK